MMRPDSAAAEILAGGLAVLAAAGVAVAWNVTVRRWRWLIRAVAVGLSVLMAAATVGIAVNRQVYAYTTWADVFGDGGGVARHVASPPVLGSGGARGSEVLGMSVRGGHSHVTLPAYVYLPAGYRSDAHRRFPVIETFAGYPGSPVLWLRALEIQRMLDTEISTGRMPPTIAVIPYQTDPPGHDSECVDAVGGASFDTFLGVDVPEAVAARFRTRVDRFGWATLGVSTGGFCAVNLALRHPDQFGVAVSLSGYFSALTDRTTGDLYRGNTKVRDENSPLWRVRHLPVPQLSIFLGCAADDRSAVQQVRDFASVAPPPISLTQLIIKQGGHSGNVWKAMEPVVLDWIARHLAGPLPDGLSA